MMRQAGMNDAEAGSGMPQENEDSGRSTQGHCSDLQDRCLSGTENCGIRKGPGLVHIYFGDGKGKSTCGMGLCCRAAGYGYRVLIYQFLKDNSSSERKLLELSPNVEFLDGMDRERFSRQMSEEEKCAHRAFYEERLRLLEHKGSSGNYDVLFLDEVLYAVRAGLLDEKLLTDFLDSRPQDLEVILTGRDPGEELLQRADYISEIRMIRHPISRGQKARGGIER